MISESEIDSDRVARAVWSAIIEPPDLVAHKIISILGAISPLKQILKSTNEDSSFEGIASKCGVRLDDLRRAKARWEPRLRSFSLSKIANDVSRYGITFLCPGDEGWPVQLKDLGDETPVGLWVRGQLPKGVPVAMVGARISSNYGENVAYEFAHDLAEAGSVVVSGGAYGIDASAHRGALSANGNTIAFMAGGLDRLYPSDLADIHGEIINTGAIVSEFPPGARPARWRFLSRNRLIAAYAASTIVVEANIRSGALNTARSALGIGRSVGAVPGPIHSQTSAGTNQLLRDGGVPILRVENIVQLLAQACQSQLPFDLLKGDLEAGVDTTEQQELSTAEKRIVASLPPRGVTKVKNICISSGMAVSEVMATLGGMEISGLVRRQGDCWGRG